MSGATQTRAMRDGPAPTHPVHHSLAATLYCRRCRMILEDAIRQADRRNALPPDPTWPRPHLLKAAHA